MFRNDEVVIIELARGALVEGRVLDGRGQPVAGATVTAWDSLMEAPDVDGRGASHGSAVTDAEGRYSLRAPSGEGEPIHLVATNGSTELGDVAVRVTREDAQAGNRVVAPPIFSE